MFAKNHRQSHQSRGQSHSGGRKQKQRPKKPISPALLASKPQELDQLKLNGASYVVFDLETTGGNPEKNGITEIFAIRYEQGEIKATFESMVNPEVPIPPIVRKMTGINNAMVKNAPKILEVMPKFLEFLQDSILVSHNTQGDLKFLRHFAKQTANVDLQNFFLCTHLLVEKLFKETPNKSLKGLAKHFELNANGKLHRAEADAFVTLELFKILQERLSSRGMNLVVEAIRLQGDMESSQRLNWNIPKDKMDRLPQSPGVFYLFDKERRVIFVSSALTLSKEFSRLQKPELIPRPLYKISFRAHDLDFERTFNSFDALQKEADAFSLHPGLLDPSIFHQRSQAAIVCSEVNGEFLIDIGPFVERTVWSFGPVRDRKRMTEFLLLIAQKFKRAKARSGFLVTKEQADWIYDFLQVAAQRESSQKWYSFLVFWRRQHKVKKLSAKNPLKALVGKVPELQLDDLFSTTGLICVPEDSAGAWAIYPIAGLLPRGKYQVRGDLEARLREGAFGKRLLDLLVKPSSAASRPIFLEGSDVLRANHTIWWMRNHEARKEGRFISLLELDEIIRENNA